MTKVVFDVSISVDGFLGGPNASLEESLGAGGGALHEWAFATKRFREQHGLDGGEEVSSPISWTSGCARPARRWWAVSSACAEEPHRRRRQGSGA